MNQNQAERWRHTQDLKKLADTILREIDNADLSHSDNSLIQEIEGLCHTIQENCYSVAADILDEVMKK